MQIPVQFRTCTGRAAHSLIPQLWVPHPSRILRRVGWHEAHSSLQRGCSVLGSWHSFFEIRNIDGGTPSHVHVTGLTPSSRSPVKNEIPAVADHSLSLRHDSDMQPVQSVRKVSGSICPIFDRFIPQNHPPTPGVPRNPPPPAPSGGLPFQIHILKISPRVLFSK